MSAPTIRDVIHEAFTFSNSDEPWREVVQFATAASAMFCMHATIAGALAATLSSDPTWLILSTPPTVSVFLVGIICSALPLDSRPDRITVLVCGFAAPLILICVVPALILWKGRRIALLPVHAVWWLMTGLPESIGRWIRRTIDRRTNRLPAARIAGPHK